MADRRRVLIVDDDDGIRRSLKRILLREGYDVLEARDGIAGIAVIEQQPLDLVITDLRMPRADGTAVLAAGVKRRIPVVVISGDDASETAIEMMNAGAATFLVKPFDNARLRTMLADTLGAAPAPAPVAPVTPAAAGPAPRQVSPGTHGEDPAFLEVLSRIERVADTLATVLLLGESGTGKEVAARLVHQCSPRAHGPFVAVNCGAIPRELIEAELFGHTKGAFTDATQPRSGCLQDADGGTIFLDEIGDMPLDMQVKLLRALQERAIKRLGDSQTRAIDVRVVAATNQDLAGLVQAGKFRGDLYYRLRVVEIRLPSLWQRPRDIRVLARHFLAFFNARDRRGVTGFAEAVLAAFEGYHWPGNIRELANVVEAMVALKREGGELGLKDLPHDLAVDDRPRGGAGPGLRHVLPEDGLDLRLHLAAVEEDLVRQAMERARGEKAGAARLLRINRTTLVERLKRVEGLRQYPAVAATDFEALGDDEDALRGGSPRA